MMAATLPMPNGETVENTTMSSGAALVKRPWTPEEDELLVAAVHKYGASRWSMIATQLSTGRVGKQCRERWNNHLCPEVKKSEWTETEDHAIMQGVAVLGTRWCEIVKAPELVGRTDNSIKNRFYALERKMKAKHGGGGRNSQQESLRASPVALTPSERIMSIARELAFTVDECERDTLIEQLTVIAHEGALASEEAAVLGDGLSEALFDAQPTDPPADLPPMPTVQELKLADETHAAHFGQNNGTSGLGAMGNPSGEMPSELADIVAELAGYLDGPKKAAAKLVLSPGSASGRLSAQSHESDARSDAATMRFDEQQASDIGDDSSSAASSDESTPPRGARSGLSRPKPLAADLTDQKLSDGTEAPAVVLLGAGGLTPGPHASTLDLTECETSSASPKLDTTAALLGGRHAHKALLAPLRVPLDDSSNVDSPKRMRTTPSGASAVPWHSRRPSALSQQSHSAVVSTAASAAPASIKPALRCTAAVTGTKEPGTAASPLAASSPLTSSSPAISPYASSAMAQELLSLSEFTDLFADEIEICEIKVSLASPVNAPAPLSGGKRKPIEIC